RDAKVSRSFAGSPARGQLSAESCPGVQACSAIPQNAEEMTEARIFDVLVPLLSPGREFAFSLFARLRRTARPDSARHRSVCSVRRSTKRKRCRCRLSRGAPANARDPLLV